MDPTRDNPIIRFATFWWGLGTFLVFALLLAVIWLFNRQAPESFEDVVAKGRYETAARIAREQAASLPQAAIDAAMPAVARELVAAKPAAVAKPEQLVPGSPTAVKQAAPAEPLDPAVMALGKAQFLICSACHGQNGEGGPLAPPLAGSNWVAGPAVNLMRIQLRGLLGPITVKGTEYKLPAGMPAQAYQTDEQLASVLTYVRNSFGNSAPAVKPADVTPLRSEVGKPQLNPQELIQP